MAWPVLSREQYDKTIALAHELQGKPHDAAALDARYPCDEFAVAVELRRRGLDFKQATITSFGIANKIAQKSKAWNPGLIDALAARLEKQGRVTLEARQRGKDCKTFEEFYLALSTDLREQFKKAAKHG